MMAAVAQSSAIGLGLDGGQQPAPQTAQSKSTKTTTTTTTKTIYTTTTKQNLTPNQDELSSVAYVEDLGKQATPIPSVQTNRKVSPGFGGGTDRHRRTSNTQKTTTNKREVRDSSKLSELVNGDEHVTTIGTVAAQSGYSRLVLALLKDGNKLQLKIQEMRPGMFDVGANEKECAKYLEEHRKFVANLRKQKQTPMDGWMQKYRKIANEKGRESGSERKLVYGCMLENLQGCWRALLNQLDERLALLEETYNFYESAKQLVEALDRADNHVQEFRQEFLDGTNPDRFNTVCNELKRLNEDSLERYNAAHLKQQVLVSSIEALGNGNLGDSRKGYLISDAQNLINYINTYLEPYQKRRIQLESVISTSKFVENRTNSSTGRPPNHLNATNQRDLSTQLMSEHSFPAHSTNSITTKTATSIREISNFNDLNLVENWLQLKIDQLNSSLLSSLGVSVPDSRSIADKHEQIALECRTIEEATLTFNGRNINSIKSIDPKDDKIQGDKSLLEQQRLLSARARDVITILEARLVLLKRSMDFYLRSKEATYDIDKMMRRLQIDNSLQSVQFVSNELELKDVSSVVASGATIISELQQLQLAQQHGQRSRIVNLNLATGGIRAIIDQLNQDLAHLKTILNQRRLVLLNEDAAKMANNFSNKCHQLQFWLNNHVKSFLIAKNRLNCNDLVEVSQFCDSYEQTRTAVQSKTLEVEALLRSLTTLTEHFSAKSKTLDDIQRNTDELRHDWISSTNCLEGRLEFARRYLAILRSGSAASKELSNLDRFNSGESIPDGRTDEDIRASINQILLDLASQIKQFQLEAKKNSTEFVYHPSTLRGSTIAENGRERQLEINDLNKQQLLDRANEMLRQFEDEQKMIESRDRMASSAAKPLADPAHRRPQQLDPPRFTRVLVDKAVEPFSSVELVCETDDSDCQVDWFMNNFKRIPPAIRHTCSSEGNQHKLTINNFSSICCGTYLVRASNRAGQATSQCKLRLAGIVEAQENETQLAKEPAANRARQAEGSEEVDVRQQTWRPHNQPGTGQTVTDETVNQRRDLNAQVSPGSRDVTSSSSSFSHWRPETGADGSRQTRSTKTIEESTETTISRVIQGVEDKRAELDGASSSSPGNPLIRISQLNNSDSDITIDTTTTANNNGSNFRDKFPITQTTYKGQLMAQNNNDDNSGANGINLNSSGGNNQHLRVSYIDSPEVSNASTLSRSVSKSPFDGTPQPPVFVQGLQNAMPGCCSRAGLVCLVMGNPAPTIEWLHNKQLIATAKCARPASGCPKGGICKLTIETTNPQTEGQYTCRASNRLGKTSTNYTLTN